MVIPPYTADDFMADLDRMTQGRMNRALATMSERGFGADLGAPIWAMLPTLREDLAPKLAAALQRAGAAEAAWGWFHGVSVSRVSQDRAAALPGPESEV